MSRFCVIAGTKISLTNGNSLPIEQIKAGEEVLSFDLNTLQRSQKYDVLVKLKTNDFSGVIKKDYVKNIWKNTADEYFAINDRLKITGDHIVLAKRDNTYYWTKVFNLKIGDYLFTEFNIFEKIETIILIKEKVKVFNLEVNSIYNYFANSYLIHNGAPCSACLNCGNSIWRYEESLYKMHGGSSNNSKIPVLINKGYGNRGGSLDPSVASPAIAAHSNNRGGPFSTGSGGVIFWVEPGRKLASYNITGGWSTGLSSYNMSNIGLNSIYLTNKPENDVPNIIFSDVGTPGHNNFNGAPTDPSVWHTSSSVLPGFTYQESTILGFSLDEFWRDGSNTDENTGGYTGIAIRKRVVVGLKNSFSYLDPYGDKMCTTESTAASGFVPRNNSSSSDSSVHHNGESTVLWLQLTGYSGFPKQLTSNNIIGLPHVGNETTFHNGGGSNGGNSSTAVGGSTAFNLSGYGTVKHTLSNGAGTSGGNFIIGNGEASGMDLIYEITYFPADTTRSFAPAEHQKLRIFLHKRSDGLDNVSANNGFVNIFSDATNCTLGDIAADIATDGSSSTLKQRHFVLPRYYRRTNTSTSSANNVNILNTNWTFLVRDSTSSSPANSFAISLKNYNDYM